MGCSVRLAKKTTAAVGAPEAFSPSTPKFDRNMSLRVPLVIHRAGDVAGGGRVEGRRTALVDTDRAEGHLMPHETSPDAGCTHRTEDIRAKQGSGGTRRRKDHKEVLG